MEENQNKNQMQTQKKELTEEELRKKWNLKNLYGKTQDEVMALQNEAMQELRDTADEGEKKALQKYQSKHRQAIKAKQSKKQQNEDTQDIPLDGDYINGSAIYSRNCISCHSLEQDSKGRKTSGPALGMIYGKMASTDLSYSHYSQPMLDVDYQWNARNLFHYLFDSKRFIPQSLCEAQLTSAEERSDLIIFLKLFTKELRKNLKIKQSQAYSQEHIDIQINTQINMSKGKPGDNR